MRTTEFVQLLEKTVQFGTIWSMELTAKDSTKNVQFFSLVVQLFNGCTAFQKYTHEYHRICTALQKPVHFSANTNVNETKTEEQCSKDVQLFSLVVQLFNGCTAF